MFGDGGGGYDDETNDLGLLLFWRLEADLTHTPLIFESVVLEDNEVIVLMINNEIKIHLLLIFLILDQSSSFLFFVPNNPIPRDLLCDSPIWQSCTVLTFLSNLPLKVFLSNYLKVFPPNCLKVVKVLHPALSPLNQLVLPCCTAPGTQLLQNHPGGEW